MIPLLSSLLPALLLLGLALLTGVDATTCYHSSGSYYLYCSEGCCYSYSSYYGGSTTSCCTDAGDALYIGLGITAAIIVIVVIVVVVIILMKQQGAKRMSVKPRTTQPVTTGTTVHTTGQFTPYQPPQQPQPMNNFAPQPPPPYGQPPNPYGQPPNPYGPPPPVTGSDPVYPPPPPAYPYGGTAGPY